MLTGMRAHSVRTGRMDGLQLGTPLLLILAVSVLLLATPALAIGGFSPSLFKFAPGVRDDGQDLAAGWQVANAELRFVDTRPVIPRIWSCHVTVGMPLRTAVLGRISPEAAAEMTADIATAASTRVMRSRQEWLSAEFCKAFKNEMNLLFFENHRGLGAKVTSP
jgi:hypothetical protein